MGEIVVKNNPEEETKETIDVIFERVADKLNEHGIPWWPEAGSMLGCYREGKRIEWDYDYDIAYPYERAPDVLKALLEIPGVFINWNFYYSLITENNPRNHKICIQPHAMTTEGIYKLETSFRYFITNVIYTIDNNILKNRRISESVGFVSSFIEDLSKLIGYRNRNAFGFYINYFIRKLPFLFQKLIVKLSMKTYKRVRFRGTKEEYSSWYKAKLGDVETRLPVGVESILERHYGKDFMTPTRRKDYSHEDKGLL